MATRAVKRKPTHREHEDHPWTIEIPDHPRRSESRAYRHSRSVMNKMARGLPNLLYGKRPYEDHHGGGLWLKDAAGWFLVRNLAGIEWSAQFCADPEKVDQLRINAKRLYAKFPGSAHELGIEAVLNTPITDDAGVAAWTDSLANASVPLPTDAHVGVIPRASTGGVHHYPAPIVDIAFFKRDDFVLWVTDEDGQPAAVAPVNRLSSGDRRVQVLYATPGSRLAAQKASAAVERKPYILPEDHGMARQAFMATAIAPAESDR